MESQTSGRCRGTGPGWACSGNAPEYAGRACGYVQNRLAVGLFGEWSGSQLVECGREYCIAPLQPDDPFQTTKCDLLLTPGPPQDGEAERLQQGWRRCAEAKTNRGPHPVGLLFDPAECCILVVVACHGPAAPLPAVPPAKGGAGRLVLGLRLWTHGRGLMTIRTWPSRVQRAFGANG